MKHSHSVISAYVTLKKFTPGLQKIYTDISAISATFSNSANLPGEKTNTNLWTGEKINTNLWSG